MQPHRLAIRVYYEDTDLGGIVYHANYLRFIERARTEMLREAGIGQAALRDAHRLQFVVRRISADYLRPAGLDDLIEVETELTTLRGASLDLAQRITCRDVPLFDATVLVACVTTDGRPARLPPELRKKLTPRQG